MMYDVVAEHVVTLFSYFFAIVAGGALTRYYALKAEVRLDEQVQKLEQQGERLERVVANVAEVVKDPDDTRLDPYTRNLVRSARASTTQGAVGSASATVIPAFDRSKFDELRAEWTERREAVKGEIDARGPGCKEIMFP